MREPRNGGGPVFPLEVETATGRLHIPGISLRDFFAAAALTGITTLHLTPEQAQATKDAAGGGRMSWTEFVANAAYQHADAMLKARGE